MSLMKKLLRSQARQTLLAMPPDVRARKSAQAAQALIALAEFAQARSVMLYLPMADEVDTASIAQAAWQAGKHVLAPRTEAATRTMQAYEIHSLSEGLAPADKYGILEPSAGLPWPEEQIDFIVVPALGFDRRGGRLGRGAGYYDRFLIKATAALACGLAFDEQTFDELPMFDHDRRVDIVVTDSQVLDFRKQQT